MTGKTLVISSPKDISQDHLGEFETHTRGIRSKFLRHMGYDGKGIGKRIQGIQRTIVVEYRVKHESLGFDGGKEKEMNNMMMFVKEKDMTKLFFSSEEILVAHEAENSLPP